jgi:VanZ family protein/O-antigen ligase
LKTSVNPLQLIAQIVHAMLVAIVLGLLAWTSVHLELVFGTARFATFPPNWAPWIGLVYPSLLAVALMWLAPVRPALALLLFAAIGYGFPRQEYFEFFCRWHITEAISLLGISGVLAANAPSRHLDMFRELLRNPYCGMMFGLLLWMGISCAIAYHGGNYRPVFNHHPIQMCSAGGLLITAFYCLRSNVWWYWLAMSLGGALCMRILLAPQYLHLEGDMGVLLSISIPLSIAAFCVASNWFWRISTLPILAIECVGLLRTENRGGLLALAAALLVGWLFCRWRWRLLAVGLPVVVLASFTFVNTHYWDRFESIWKGGDDRASMDSRFIIYDAGIKMARANPLFGVGLGNFQLRMKEYSQKGNADSHHNNVIGMFAETGVVGGLLYLGLFIGAIVVAFYHAWRLRQESAHWIALGAGASLVAYQISGMFMTRHTLELAYLLAGGAIALKYLPKTDEQQLEKIEVATRPTSLVPKYVWQVGWMGWAMLTMLGSWYPFDYRQGSLLTAWGQFLDSVEAGAPKSDLAVNLMLGIPLGFLGYLAINAGTRMQASERKNAQLLLAALVPLCVLGAVALNGLFVELGQHWFGNRVLSIYDTLAQTAGGAIGLAISVAFGHWISQRLYWLMQHNLAHSPLRALLDLYLLGFVIWMLIPFIPSVSPSELKAKWNSGMVDLSLFSEWQSNWWQAAYTASIASITALPIGVWFAHRNFWGFCGSRGLDAAIGSCCLISLLEISQIFIETRTASVSDVLWSCIGACIGVVVFFYAIANESGKSKLGLRLSPFLLVAVSLIYAASYLAIAWAPFDWVSSAEIAAERIRTIKESLFTGLFTGNDMLGASNLIRTICFSIPLGVLFTLPTINVDRSFRAIALAVSCFLTILFCVLAEFGQIFSNLHNPGILDEITRVLGGMIGVGLGISVNRQHVSSSPKKLENEPK